MEISEYNVLYLAGIESIFKIFCRGAGRLNLLDRHGSGPNAILRQRILRDDVDPRSVLFRGRVAPALHE